MHAPTLRLPRVTLVAVDTRHPARAARAMQHCMDLVAFRDALLFTHRPLPLPPGVRRVPIPPLDGLEDYSDFMVRDLPVYAPLLADHFLVVQHDGFVVDPAAWDDAFLGYDYVGAPWGDGPVGNGGFSLRSRRLLYAQEEAAALLAETHPEDLALCLRYRALLETRGVRFAPPEVGRRFSVENEPYRGSFGYHGWQTERLGGFSLDDTRPLVTAAPAVPPPAAGTAAMPSIAALYEAARDTPSDINEHAPVLAALARRCGHVTEFGNRSGVSTRALLYGKPATLVSYDARPFGPADALARIARAGGVDFRFVQADVLDVEIDGTDLLLLDTYHTYAQVAAELRAHAAKVRRYLVFHDTATYGETGEDGGPGIWRAVAEFLDGHPEWRLAHRYENNNGLAVLERTGAVAAAGEPADAGAGPDDPLLRHLFEVARDRPSDINEHVGTLRRLAAGCGHVTELGIAGGAATAAFLAARPRRVVAVQALTGGGEDGAPPPPPCVPGLEDAAARAGVSFGFFRADSLAWDAEETDLLLIDTQHTYDRMRAELARHAPKARAWIVCHDTTVFGERGEIPGSRGVWPAVAEFLDAHPEWRLWARYHHNNGLAVLRRDDDFAGPADAGEGVREDSSVGFPGRTPGGVPEAPPEATPEALPAPAPRGTGRGRGAPPRGRKGRADLTVAYRVFPGFSHGPAAFGNDKLLLATVAARSFRRALGDMRVRVRLLLDGCPDAYGEALLPSWNRER